VGFGHKTGTCEVTFFTDVGVGWLTSVNRKPLSDWPRKAKKDFTPDERIPNDDVKPRR
jgi:hypothetical protein